MASITFNLNKDTVDRLNRLVAQHSTDTAPKTKTAIVRDALRLYEEATTACVAASARVNSMGFYVQHRSTVPNS